MTGGSASTRRHEARLKAEVAVVGHAEWAEFVRVERVPDPGQIVHAESLGQLAAGGGAVAAVQVARLTGGCLFVTALGNDELSDRIGPALTSSSVDVVAARRDSPQRRAFVYLDSTGERTITTIGERHGPRGEDELPQQRFADLDSIYFTAGDAGALRAARAARVPGGDCPGAVRRLSIPGFKWTYSWPAPTTEVSATSRGDIDPVPAWVVRTDGPRRRIARSRRRYDHRLVARCRCEGPTGDSYGAGDSFAAGLTCGLGMGHAIEDAISLGAFCGASAVARRSRPVRVPGVGR